MTIHHVGGSIDFRQDNNRIAHLETLCTNLTKRIEALENQNEDLIQRLKNLEDTSTSR